jgi:hypothetical protein
MLCIPLRVEQTLSFPKSTQEPTRCGSDHHGPDGASPDELLAGARKPMNIILTLLEKNVCLIAELSEFFLNGIRNNAAGFYEIIGRFFRLISEAFRCVRHSYSPGLKVRMPLVCRAAFVVAK